MNALNSSKAAELSRRNLLVLTAAAATAVPTSAVFGNEPVGEDKPSISNSQPIPKNGLVVIVMDPMAAPLACDCVQGYAQRKYEELGSYLQQRLKIPVAVVWSESLVTAMNEKSEGRADIVIGKDSVVRSDAKRSKIAVNPIASLTDTKGSTRQRGLFVVRSSGKASSLVDIENFTVLWGPEDCDEKWAAPRAKLKELDVPFSDQSKQCNSCSIAAKELMTLPEDTQTVAVISSYAQPLLEGCGTIKKGDLKVIGESDDVPFITCFVNDRLPEDRKAAIKLALDEMKSPEMLKALETKLGFVPYTSSSK
ncbi:MAG: PhnD/SsuA/transferrin family substrate-binding protein [Pirellulales bacterium]